MEIHMETYRDSFFYLAWDGMRALLLLLLLIAPNIGNWEDDESNLAGKGMVFIP